MSPYMDNVCPVLMRHEELDGRPDGERQKSLEGTLTLVKREANTEKQWGVFFSKAPVVSTLT
jgi:hypothetical protein